MSGLVAAHPRSRGENWVFLRRVARRRGSSPLTRGKLGWFQTYVLPVRLIPAHAGKTGWPARNILPDEGSSPLTRGKLDDADRAHRLGRLIPAHAGKTLRW